MVPSPNKNPVFVPSPRWLSESPARPGTLTHIDFDGERTPSSQRSRDRSQTLWSPAPPPPANLYPEGAATFNVDPGVPFLATAGPMDAGSSEGGSITEDSPRDKRFVGGFIMKAVTLVRSSRNFVALDMLDGCPSLTHPLPSLPHNMFFSFL
ncbi:hypothetical protein M413DRAFT_238986 [Hebeloma cylindrosporum]|uniref:Uncharacterized protein n=1 Tax=Hebeloma cylindrosporum TaxID=76867 RepID=A0A0C2XMD3_HEBCY|nr:hypothetical protein M413DRAFT_238986 [Hebeloma cylindrosporum h7]